MKNKYVVELVVEAETDLTKKRVRELLEETLLLLPISGKNISKVRIRSVDKD